MKKKTQLDRLPMELMIPEGVQELTFNLIEALPGRASSRHTHRAYFRWVDEYLVSIAGMKPSRGQARIRRMEMLPVKTLVDSLSPMQFRAWLGRLSAAGNGKQGIGQARASILTLASLLSEAGWLEDHISAGMGNVRAPRAEEGQRPGRWLSTEQIKLLMESAPMIAKSRNGGLRNKVVITTLCTMALRREELANATWGDLSIQNNRYVLRVHGKGRKHAQIDVPRPVLRALEEWRQVVAPGDPRPAPETPLVRRIYKGKLGRVSHRPLTADGIWYIVSESADFAQIGHVAPHDLRRSVAGALQEAGTPIETISRLLRHSNVAVTERYLSRLPQRNEGAVLMSDVLGLNDEGDDWPGFEDYTSS
ncbi:MAG: tyrosine-type recombinase/integrase [Anaerolineae bacterium]